MTHRVLAYAGEALRFGGVGIAATVTHYIAALFLSRGCGIEPGWAAFLGVNASALISYIGHGRLTFRRQLNHRSMLPRFVVSTILAYTISFFGSRMLTGSGQLPDFVAYAVVVVSIVIFNFILFRFWVFR